MIEWAGKLEEQPADVRFDPRSAELVLTLCGKTFARVHLPKDVRWQLANDLTAGLPDSITTATGRASGA